MDVEGELLRVGFVVMAAVLAVESALAVVLRLEVLVTGLGTAPGVEGASAAMVVA